MRLKTSASIAIRLLLATTFATSIAIADDRRLNAPSSAPSTAQVTAVGPIAINVSDLDRAVSFYSDVLMFDVLAREQRDGPTFASLYDLPEARASVARLRLGDEQIELIEFESPRGRTFPSDSRSNDRWFQHIAIIVNDMDAAYARLREHAVRPASADGPQRLPDWNPNAAGIRAYYFRDPDGHYLEILQFPAGKGDAKWHAPSARLFLGIDHTAIVVADTDASLRFYRDTLGLRLAGESRNHGVEQERLNNVPGASLRITTLRAAAGPGIELLEYLTPRDGRPYPPDASDNDLLVWHTRLIAPAVRAPHALKDPDGHALHLVRRDAR